MSSMIAFHIQPTSLAQDTDLSRAPRLETSTLSRVVGHLDLDYFYAQVEEVENPNLRNLPILVCVYSGRTEDSGVVSTANYVARGYGVKSAMPIALAKKKLDGVQSAFIPMKHEKYEVISEHIM